MKTIKKGTKERTQDLHIRVSKREKDKLVKEAENLGISVSEYVRPLIMEKKCREKPMGKLSKAVALCQDIVNHVQEKYCCEDDEELIERMEKLWEIL